MTAATAAAPVFSATQRVQAQTILQKAVCLTLDCHFLGNNRKVDLGAVVKAAVGSEAYDEAEALVDEEQFSVAMKLIPTDELSSARRKVNHAKALLRKRAIPTPRVFGERSYLIPRDAIEAVDAELEQLAAEVRAESAALSVRYAAAVERQKAVQGGLAAHVKYPTAADVAQAFWIDWAYVSFAAPDNLETVSAALARKAHQKHEQRLARAFEEVVVGLRAEAVDVLRDLEDRLTPKADGTRKALRGTALRDLDEFLATLPSRNLAGDAELPAALERVRARAAGLDVEQLKDSDSLRAGLREAAAGARAALEQLVKDAPRRAMFRPGEAL
jgi:hypothetical protein